MSLQFIINSAVSVEVNRSQLVAQSISRSGKVLTASRNWVNPWRFVVEPQPVWLHSNYRSLFEPVINGDKYAEYTIKLGQGTQSWLTEYLGEVSIGGIAYGNANFPKGGVLQGVTVYSATQGTAKITLNIGGLDATKVVKIGDVIQVTGYRYPYVVTSTAVVGGKLEVGIHRQWLDGNITDGTTKTLTVGTSCQFKVKVTKMPTTKFISGKLVEFTSNFDLIEVVDDVIQQANVNYNWEGF